MSRRDKSSDAIDNLKWSIGLRGYAQRSTGKTSIQMFEQLIFAIDDERTIRKLKKCIAGSKCATHIGSVHSGDRHTRRDSYNMRDR